jgi:hypothetical protein
MDMKMSRLAILPFSVAFFTWVLPAHGDCVGYGSSGPITVTRNGQVIENLVITSTDGPAIQINGFSGVNINNVVIHHNGGQGITLAFAPSATISNADIIFDGAPPVGADPSTNDNNIDCLKSDGLTVSNVRLTKGSSGIYLNQCRGSTLSGIEGHDQRGPFPRGQLVQWDNSNHGTLTDFSDENSLVTSWTEDNVNIYQSRHIRISDGLVDTNNSPSGDGVIADNLSGDVLVGNVDAIHQGNGCFAAYGGGEFNVTFRATRCRDNYCTLPRGNPLSGSLAWGLDPKAIKGKLNIERSVYANLCNPDNIVFDASRATILQLRPRDFTPRPPLRVQLCQYGYQRPGKR